MGSGASFLTKKLIQKSHVNNQSQDTNHTNNNNVDPSEPGVHMEILPLIEETKSDHLKELTQEPPSRLYISHQLSNDVSSDDLNIANADGFSHTALAFDMDDNDLLFNILYFNESNNGTEIENLGQICETVLTETVAAHSEGNTPYKLHPASEKLKNSFKSKKLESLEYKLDNCECQICKDDMSDNSDIIFLSNCKHCFHHECFIRWIELQAWCPVCRYKIEDDFLSQISGEFTPCNLSSKIDF